MGLEEIKSRILTQIEGEVAQLEQNYAETVELLKNEQINKMRKLEDEFSQKKKMIEEGFFQKLRIQKSIEDKKLKMQKEGRFYDALFESTLIALEKSSSDKLGEYVVTMLSTLELPLEECVLEVAECHKGCEALILKSVKKFRVQLKSVALSNFRGGFKLKFRKFEYNFSFEKVLDEKRDSLILLLREEGLGAAYE